MANGWTETTLGELCDRGQVRIQTGPFGSQLHSYDYQAVGVPVIPTEGIGRRRLRDEDIPRVSEEMANRLSRHKLKTGDILFARRGAQATGLSALIESKHVGWLCGTGAILLRVETPDIDTTFLSFVLSSDEAIAWLKTHAVGAVMPNLNAGVLRRLPLRFPPLTEQKSIASVLSALDDKIELNRLMNETLEAVTQTIFKNWFVDAAATKLPKGWREVSFTETVDLLGGGTPKTSVAEFWNGDIPWFSVVDAPTETDIFVIQTEKMITRAGVDNSSTRILPVGTTIISARGTVGKLALVGVPMAMNQSCYGLHGIIGKKGYYSYFSTRALVSTLQQRAHGSIFDTITRDTLTGVQVIAPTEEVVAEFEELISPLMERIRNNLFESHTLAELRDALSPKLLSGELRVPANVLECRP